MSFKTLTFTLLCIAASINVFATNTVVLITVDTFRADYLDSGKTKTPNIDRLISNGVFFQNTVSAVPYTLPSHASILTGLLPPEHSIRDNSGFVLPKNVPTMADYFHQAGYRTGAFIGAYPLDSRFGLDRGFDFYDDSYPVMNQHSEMTMPERSAEAVTSAALQWVESHKDNRIFIWVHYYDAHFPYNPPAPFRSSDLYAGELEYVDSQIGRLLNELPANSRIILTSDHGEGLGDHQERTHGIFAYESTMRVPLIISPFAQQKIETRVRLIDVLPTLLDLESISTQERFDGASLLPLMKGKSTDIPDSYFEALPMNLNAGWAPLKGFYSGQFKYIQLPQPELYDLKQDPHETKNLCQDQDACTQWNSKFSVFIKNFPGVSSKRLSVDAETKEKLQALGYLSGSSSSSETKEYGPQDDPKTLIRLYNRIQDAITFYKHGETAQALEILNESIEERPHQPDSYLNAAYILASSGSIAEAIAILQKAINNGLDTAEIHGRLAFYLLQADRSSEAIQQLSIALKTQPADIDFLNYLGMAQASLDSFANAEAAFRKALEVDPTNAMTLENLGTMYLTQKKSDEAIAAFAAALKQNEHLANALNGLGVAYASQQKWKEAIENWNRAIDENKTLYDAILNLGFAYLKTDDKQNALKFLHSFEESAPPSRYSQDLNQVRSLISDLEQQ